VLLSGSLCLPFSCPCCQRRQLQDACNVAATCKQNFEMLVCSFCMQPTPSASVVHLCCRPPAAATAVSAALAAVCPAGNYVTDAGTCEACPAGNAAINATSCRSCPGEMVANAGKTECYCPVPGKQQVGLGTCGEYTKNVCGALASRLDCQIYIRHACNPYPCVLLWLDSLN
jgi:hypothetical protein